jgi:hypothetical protein
MVKVFLFTLAILALFSSCGQKSIIKAQVESRTTAEAYGDGEFVVRPLFMPLSDQAISAFDSPVEKIDFIAGGFARMFMNLGASMGMGRAKLTLTQPVPEIPTDVIKGAKIKRLFLYIQPKKGKERESNFFRRFIFGQGDVNFNFLDKLAIKLTSTREEKFESWYPTFEYSGLRKREFTPLQALFEDENLYDESVNLHKENSMVILKYDRENKGKYLKNNKTGLMYILHTKKPAQSKKFLLKHPKLNNYFKQIHMLNETLVVELKKDPVIEEAFHMILGEEADVVEKFKIDQIEKCEENTCLDLEVPENDLLPLIAQGNALKVDAYLNASKAPDSFQLEGFMEFEVKLKLSF